MSSLNQMGSFDDLLGKVWDGSSPREGGESRQPLELIFQESYPTQILIPTLGGRKDTDRFVVFSQSILQANEYSEYRTDIERYARVSPLFRDNIQVDGMFGRPSEDEMSYHIYFTSARHMNLNDRTSILQMWDGEVFSLEQILLNKSCLTSTRSQKIRFIAHVFHSLCKSVEELHRNNICHNSILPKNVLIFANDLNSLDKCIVVLQLPSFGMEKSLNRINDEHLTYFSPEVFQEAARFSPENDIHMLGCLLLSAITLDEVDPKTFSTKKWMDEIQAVKERAMKTISSRNPSEYEVSKEVALKNMLNISLKCIHYKASERPTIEYVLNVAENCLKKLEEYTLETEEIEAPLFPSQKLEGVTSSYKVAPLNANSSSSSASTESNDAGKRPRSSSWKSLLKPLTTLFGKRPRRDFEEGLKKKELYEVVKRLSDGASAVVVLVKHKETHQEYVMKRYKEGASRDFERELECLSLFKHSHIIRMIDSFSYEEETNSKQKMETHVIVLEYCKFGDIFTQQLNYVRGSKVKYLKPQKFFKICTELFSALYVIQDSGYIHCDVKPQNILISVDGIKLADFGFSIKVKEPIIGGTLRYLPPEHQEGQPGQYSIDVYSMCYSLFEILSKKKINIQTKLPNIQNFAEIWDEYAQENKYFSRYKKNGNKRLDNVAYVTPLLKFFERGFDLNHKTRLQTKDARDLLQTIYHNHSATLIQKTFRGYILRKKQKSLFVKVTK